MAGLSLPLGWLLAVGALAAAQLAAALRLWLRARRRPPADAAPAPFASVVVPFKGADAELAGNVGAFLAQDYPGRLEFVFVVESREDAALPVLEAARAGEPRLRVIVSGARPERAAAQALNLAAGAAAASRDASLLVFADSDLRPRRDWARRLAAALEEPGVSAVSAVMTYDPRGGGLPSWLRLAWMSHGLPWLDALGLGAGHSMALRRADFERLGAAEAWRGTISPDLTLSALARGAGRLRLEPGAAPVGHERTDWAGLCHHMNRWLTVLRFHAPGLWWAGLLATCVKACALVQAVEPGCWPLAALVWVPDAAALALALSASGAGRWGAAALLAPLLTPLLLLNYAASSFYREIVWSGWSYFFDGPRALPGAAPARLARRERLLRLLCAAAGGVLMALAYRPGGPWGLLVFPSFPLLLRSCRGLPPLWAFWWGGVFGTAAYMTGTAWLYPLARRFIGAGPAEAAAWYFFLCAFQGGRWGLCAAAAARAGSGWRRLAAFACAAVAAEALLPTLFPTPLAATLLSHPAALQVVPRLGVLAGTALVLGSSAVLYGAAAGLPRGRAALLALAAAAAANEAWGRSCLARLAAERAAAPVLRAAVVQAGVEDLGRSLSDGFTPKPAYYELTRRAAAGKARLIVWPESSWWPALSYDRRRPGETSADGRPVQAVLRPAAGEGGAALLNAIGLAGDGKRRNVSLLVDEKRRPLGLTEKTALMPFGEYMPGGPLEPALRALSPRTGHLSRGEASVLEAGPARLGVMICYENQTPGPAAALAAAGATLLVAQVNDSWFDGTSALEQHLMHSRLRALENGRALVHAANTGVSAFVGPAGEVLARLPAGSPGVLAADVPLLSGTRPHRRRAAALAWAFLAAAAVLALSGPAGREAA